MLNENIRGNYYSRLKLMGLAFLASHLIRLIVILTHFLSFLIQLLVFLDDIIVDEYDCILALLVKDDPAPDLRDSL